MDNSLARQTVMVVGGRSGIGLAVAQLARRQGARVVVASRQAAAMAGAGMETVPFDITSEPDHVRLAAMPEAIDHLVVAVRPDLTPAPFLQTDLAAARRAFEVKFWGACRLIQALQARLRPSGSIVLTSGIAGRKIYPGAAVMAVLNNATETLCRTLAVELAPLRVNAVSPGFVAPKPPAVEELAARFPLRRLVTAAEVAAACLCLMTSPSVTGTVAVVDGGASLV